MGEDTIFGKKSPEHAKSPEKLDEYIKLEKPGIWIFFVAITLLMISAIIWSFTGKLPETIELKGYVYSKDEVRCYLPVGDNNMDLTGCIVKVVSADGGITNGEVIKVSEYPLSREELASEIASDWLADNLLMDEYNYEIWVLLEEEQNENIMATVTITVDEIRPIEFVIN